MDDLKQSVGNAVWEQKDPLVIFKFEGYKLFERLVATINKTTTSTLFKTELYVQEGQNIEQSRQSARKYKQPDRPKLQEHKQEVANSIGGDLNEQLTQNTQETEKIKQTPIRNDTFTSRNDKVSVRYVDGTILRDVKFKKVEDDIKNNKCVLIG